MKLIYTLIIIFSLGLSQAHAQTTNDDELAVKATINNLFDGMRTSDSTLIRKAFATKSIMQTIATGRDGKASVRSESVDAFIKGVTAPHPEQYDERIVFTKVLIDANLASVWTDYKFYVGDNHQEPPASKNDKAAIDSSITNKKQNEIQWKFSHCGVNSFQLFKTEEGWKIIYIIDTRRKDKCN